MMTDPIFFAEEMNRAGSLMQSGDMEGAGRLYQSLYGMLQTGTYKKRLAMRQFDKVFFGLTIDNVMGLLLNRVGWCLNACETEEALKTIQEYKQIEKDFHIRGPLDYIIDKDEIEAFRRLGNNEKALKCCDEALGRELSPKQRAELLIIKGSIESGDSHWVFGINTLSLALAEAEAVGAPELIAKCYFELASMIGTHYPALGLSFLWKARVYYEKANESEQVAFCKSRMAMDYFLLWHRCQKKESRFIEEAKRLVNEDIRREDFRHPGAQCSFDRLKGLLNNDLKLIEESADFFESIKSYGDFYRSVEFYVKVALDLGDKDAVRKGIRRYKEKAVALNDIMRQNYVRSIDWDNAVACWIPPQEPKELPNLLDVLDRIAFDEEWFHLEKGVFRLSFPTHYQEGQFETVQMPDGKTRLYPCTLYPNRYFRGQSDTLEGKKCQPSIYRGLSEAEMFHERLCLKELEILLGNYPLARVFEGEMGYRTPEGVAPLFLNVDIKALGQHYGIKTDLLDLTSDKWVAAFFASTVYKDGEYLPCKKDGNGVMYIYTHMPASNYARERLSAVGLQPFSRPGCQAGMVYRMLKDEDFNYKAERVVFKHDPAIAEFIFNYCNRSKKLFPNEILEEKVYAIKASKTYSQLALANTVKEWYQEEKEEVLLGYIEQLGIRIGIGSPVEFSDAELKDCEELLSRDMEHFFDSVNVRLAYKGPMKLVEGFDE